MSEKQSTSRSGQYLTFYLNEEEYAIAILDVREIIEYSSVTRVPGTPPYIRGVINLRGSVVPVFDLSLKFGQTASEATKLTCIIVLEARLREDEKAVLGIIADSVHQVVDLTAEQIEPPPRFGTACRVDYLLGMARIDPKFVMLLDIDRLVSADEAAATSREVVSTGVLA